MRAEVGLGIVAATLVTFGLIGSNSLFCQCPVEAQQSPPNPVRDKQIGDADLAEARQLVPPPRVPPPPEAPHGAPHGPIVSRFTISVSPIFEGGAVGKPVPLTVEIRGDGFATECIPHGAWQKKLPDKVKEALESALAEAVSEEPPANSRLDEIVHRLDRIERRLKQIERKKSGK